MKTEEVARVVTDNSNDPGCGARAVGFYVTVRYGKRSGFLLGPYGTHAEALANVDRARHHAQEFYPLASICGFGTAKATAKPGRELPTGSFNDVIGLAAGEKR